MTLIGLDVGTTGCKAVVFSEEGEPLGSAYREYGIDTDNSGKAEQDTGLVWRLSTSVLAEAVERAGAPEIAGLSLSVQGDAIIPLGADGEPIYPAILGMDYRSAPEAEACAARFGAEALFARTGMRPHPLNSLSKILWLRAKRPEVWARTRKVATYADFILGRLGAPGFIDLTMASRTMAWDIGRGDWADDLLGELSLDRSLFSTPVATGTVCGRLDPALARELGVTGPAALVAGAHDQPAGALGAGVLEDGDAVVSTGTAEVLSTTFVNRSGASGLFAGYYPCTLSALPGRYFTFSLNHVGGLMLRWHRDLFGLAEVLEAERQGCDPYDAILSNLPAGPSPAMVLPHLNGAGTPTCDPFSMGAFVGLTLATRREDIVKAIIECQTYELALNLKALLAAGVEVRRLTAIGGGARSEAWLRTKADVLALPVRTVEVAEAGCLGAAIFAGVGTGAYKSAVEGVRRAVRFKLEYKPDMDAHAAYARRFDLYKDLHGALRPIHERLRG
jgi:xylulokinase